MRYHYKSPQVLFAGKRVDVISVEVDHPKGGKTKKELISHPGAVVILPLLDRETLLLIRNERPVVQETLWELPAGTLEHEEEPLVCAKRELIEETGYEGQHFTFLLDFFSTPGFCNEKLFVFVAEELHFVGQQLDETEKIEVVPTKISDALEMVKNRVIRDAKTITTLLYFASYCHTKQ